MELMAPNCVGSVAPLGLALLAALVGAGFRATFHAHAAVDRFAAFPAAPPLPRSWIRRLQKLADSVAWPYERSRRTG